MSPVQRVSLGVAMACVVAAATACSSGGKQTPGLGPAPTTPGGAAVGSLQVSSTAMPNNSTVSATQVADSRGCTGGNRSPDVSWSGAPTATKSYAITLFDSDARGGRGFWHWVGFDIPASTTSLPSGIAPHAPAIRQAVDDAGTPGYFGPCPPSGPAHHYTLTVYALDAPTLDVPDGAADAAARSAIGAHTLAKGSVTATYASK